MKKIFATIAAMVVILSVFAQAPQKMSYQAVIRDAGNALVPSHAVGMRISILQGSTSGTVVYTETQTPTTNVNGLLSIEIGGGTGFNTIDWSSGPYFLKTETDPTGGTSYTITGTSQVLSVPYAFHAKTSETATDAVKVTGDQTIGGNKTFTGTITGTINANNKMVSNVAAPVANNDAVNKAYVDALLVQIEILAGARVKDIDGNIYPVIKIGNQEWMAQNLRTKKYRNGDMIATTNPARLDISGESNPKYQWAYDGNETNVDTYGRLYTWYAVTDSRNICPDGWHVPNEDDWMVLEAFLGGSTLAGGKLKEVGTDHWLNPNSGANNQSGFTALPGGYRDLAMSEFYYIEMQGYFWSSTEVDITWANSRVLTSESSSLITSGSSKKDGLPVRCLNGTIPSVSTTPVTSFTSNSAIVGCNVLSDGNTTGINSGVYWGTSQNPETTGTKLYISGGTGLFSASLSGLSPNTTYYVRAYATNIVGTSYGNEVSFIISEQF